MYSWPSLNVIHREYEKYNINSMYNDQPENMPIFQTIKIKIFELKN